MHFVSGPEGRASDDLSEQGDAERFCRDLNAAYRLGYHEAMKMKQKVTA
jgi:hypothetical protein